VHCTPSQHSVGEQHSPLQHLRPSPQNEPSLAVVQSLRFWVGLQYWQALSGLTSPLSNDSIPIVQRHGLQPSGVQHWFGPQQSPLQHTRSLAQQPSPHGE
jgi:hypothetical protein